MTENWEEKIDKEMKMFNVRLDPHEAECARVLVRNAIEKREERERQLKLL